MSNERHRLTSSIGAGFDRRITQMWSWLFLGQRALYGLSAARILVGLAAMGILVSNFRVRHVLWGSGSAWVNAYREDSDFGWMLSIFGASSPALFTLKYVVLMLIALAVIIGYRTRASTLLLTFGIGILVERAGPLSNQGDNILRIGLILMVFMNASAYWSLDARRRRKSEAHNGRGVKPILQRMWHSQPLLPEWLGTLIHNVALIGLALQIFILYTASALFKAQGSNWQEGTALYYPINLPEYSVFPGINALLSSNGVMVTLGTYFAFYTQLFFVMGLLHPITRRIALFGIIMMHLGIAVLMGLPWFSIAMVAFDTIFISEGTYASLERIISSWWHKRRARARKPVRSSTS